MKILYIISSYNIYGGTPKKTLDLLNYFKGRSCLYSYNGAYPEFRPQFQESGAKVYEGDYGRNLFFHVRKLLRIVDEDKVDVIHTQFTMGEVLAYCVKVLRPHVKLVVAFVGPFRPKGIKYAIANHIYRQVDAFVYISKYVKSEKIKQYPALLLKYGVVVYNGTELRKVLNEDFMKFKRPSLLGVAALLDWKNLDILVETLRIIVKERRRCVYLYVAGDGAERENLERKINDYKLNDNIFLLGNQKNIGALLGQADIYLHPAYAEGFGIAVAEAMMARKTIIVSNAGALAELIEDGVSGVVLDPYDAVAWANAILSLLDEKLRAEYLSRNAEERAHELFSIEKFVNNYEKLYVKLLGNVISG